MIFRLKVRQKTSPPHFEKELVDKTVNMKEKVQLDVQISGFPEPDVNWFLNGKRVDPEEVGVSMSFREGGYHRLEIASVTEEMQGGWSFCRYCSFS